MSNCAQVRMQGGRLHLKRAHWSESRVVMFKWIQLEWETSGQAQIHPYLLNGSVQMDEWDGW